MNDQYAPIPLKWIGPLKLIGPDVVDTLEVPLATFETPLWPSCARGAACSLKAGGIQVTVCDDRMSRSVLVEAKCARSAFDARQFLFANKDAIKNVCESSSRHIQFLNMHVQQVANMLYIRLEMQTDDASGHNMVTKAADATLTWIISNCPTVSYVSISANICTDKKVSAINGILGRGKSVIAEVTIDKKVLKRYLKTTPTEVVNLNCKKNLIGSILAGGVHSANAHFANMLLGIYLATGQDAANIVEGSQGITYAEVLNDALYFSVTLPNIIVGTVGSGKHLPFVQENLQKLGCLEKRSPGDNARRLAAITAATVLCGELSLLAAQTNPGELVETHMQLERAQREYLS